jgi:hypothetical protein
MQATKGDGQGGGTPRPSNHNVQIFERPHTMTTDTVNQPASAVYRPKYAFEPIVFSQKETDHVLLPGMAVMQLVDLTQDVALGAKTLVELIEWSELIEERLDDSDTPETDPQPVLSPGVRANLQRMVTASLTMLIAECESARKWAYEYHTPEGRREAAEYAAHKAGVAK